MYYLEITAHLQAYKQFFANQTSFFSVVTKKLVQLFNREWEQREEEERLLVERLLVLVRNVVSIPSDPEAEKRTENDVSVHDLLYWSMQVSSAVVIVSRRIPEPLTSVLSKCVAEL